MSALEAQEKGGDVGREFERDDRWRGRGKGVIDRKRGVGGPRNTR